MEKIIESALINDQNIIKMKLKDIDAYNIKKLLDNPNLTQSQSIKFGKVFETFLHLYKSH